MRAQASLLLSLILVAACGDSAAEPDAAAPDAIAPDVAIRTVAVPPVGSPFPVILTSLAGPSSWGTVVLTVAGASAEVSLYRGLGTTSLVAATAGPIQLAADNGATLEVTAAERDLRLLTGALAGAELVWDASRDVHVVGDIEVASGDVLAIGAGTRVLVDAGISISVRGHLESSGTEANPVLVSRAGSADWGGVRLLAGGTADLSHTWFLAGGADSALAFGHSDSQPVLFADGGRLHMTGGGVLDSTGKAFGARDAEVRLEAVVVSRCDTGGELLDSEVTIQGCWFLEIPDADGLLDDDDNDGIYLVGARAVGGEERASLIADSVFALGEDDGIDHNDALVTVERTWIRGFAHEGVAASGGRSISVSDSVVLDCEQGIEAGYGAPLVVVDHCLISGCQTGFRYGDSYDWEVSGTLRVTSSISAGNEDNVHNHVNALGGPAADAVSISCSMVDDADWDGRDGNLPGTPTWGEEGCLAPGSIGEAAACDGSALGPRACR